MKPLVGIDLGTTNSCIAVIENGEPVVIPLADGKFTLASVIAFDDDGESLIGSSAKRQSTQNIERTVVAAKRLIGRSFDEAESQQAISRLPMHCEAGPTGDIRLRVGDRLMAIQEVSALILSNLVKAASDYLNTEIKEVVVTVPAYFNDHQRQATKDACTIAGLEAIRVINEPTAAALAYGALEKRTGHLAVYDLGGGTFDVSILRVDAGTVEVLASAGDAFLGGVDFDRRIYEWVADYLRKEEGLELGSRDRNESQRVQEAAEAAKIALSETDATRISIPFLGKNPDGSPLHVDMELKRKLFEDLTGDLVDRTVQIFTDTLHDAGVDPKQIEDTIVVGGMTRMPKILDSIQNLIGKRPSFKVHPDLVVAVGAAIQAEILNDQGSDQGSDQGQPARKARLIDVTPHNLGIVALGGFSQTVIPKDTKIPSEVTKIFTTARDNQSSVRMTVAQGDSQVAKENQVLGELTLDNLPAGARGDVQIEVTFLIDDDGIVNVSARDLTSGNAQSVRFEELATLDEEEVQRMVNEHQDIVASKEEHQE
ncbi:Hsp70 family protein [Myxococcota bacterium]|nr:Hsp70 family protein [Myxococcota bacterium]